MKAHTGMILMVVTPRLVSIQRVLESSQEEACCPKSTFLFWPLSPTAGFSGLRPWIYISSLQLMPMCILVLSRPAMSSVSQVQCAPCGVCGLRCYIQPKDLTMVSLLRAKEMVCFSPQITYYKGGVYCNPERTEVRK